MINKRLLSLLKTNSKYVKLTVLYQWFSLLLNVTVIFCVATVLSMTRNKNITIETLGLLIVCVVAVLIRFRMQYLATMSSYQASLGIKKKLREKVYRKMLALGTKYQEHVSTAEVIQVAMEGVEQLEIYFSKYLPQLFYSLLAPLTLFILISFINFKVAIVLFLCVPLIPISIILIQKFAKKLLAKYWGSYTELGDSFLENLQGLTTLKIYQADGKKAVQMQKEAENFRRITMRVLIMQLNSISVMDLVAFGGAALGIVVAILEYQHQQVSFIGLVIIILVSSEFFVPLRLLGSFFHIAMNGMAASDKIFKIMDLPIPQAQSEVLDEGQQDVVVSNLSFQYQEDRQILHSVSFAVLKHHFLAIVGKSGCGKSTIASILSGQQLNYQGSVKIGGKELSSIKESELLDTITVVNHDGYLFAGTIAYNLRMAKPQATDTELWNILKMVRLDAFVKENGGLEMVLLEQGNNLSGGQKQRLVIARALLKDTPIYIFDEATSNIDVESENTIMKVIYELKQRKTVILISHRLDTVKQADAICMLAEGRLVEMGTHEELLAKGQAYATLYQTQAELLAFTKGGQVHD